MTVDPAIRFVQRTTRAVDVAARTVCAVAGFAHASRRDVHEVARAEDKTARYVNDAVPSVDVPQATVEVLVRTGDEAAPNVYVTNLTRRFRGETGRW